MSIKELESTILDLQSELARKKTSLLVACKLVDELEEKLKAAVDTLITIKKDGYGFAYDMAVLTLEQLGELK